LDRLARNVHFISGLMETNVPFLAADRPTATAFEIHIYAAMAEEERRKISHRVKEALAVKRAALAKEGKKLGNPHPLEALKLAVAAKRLAITTTPEVLKLIADRHREQKSLRTIANELNRLGIKTYRGKRWYASSINLQLNRVRRMAREEAVTRQVSAPLPAPEPPQHTRPRGPDGVPMTPLEVAASVARRLAQSPAGR
jgi:DNA invertase Pin-like site-specific DNA recombinase